uniref:Uncharacterized protein n=1 Tax=viral metagenome TaxID=1070528 RepID=A0A6H2A0T4_9ZZZZ
MRERYKIDEFFKTSAKERVNLNMLNALEDILETLQEINDKLGHTEKEVVANAKSTNRRKKGTTG